jgi:predicted O-methyltransferase YrrM
MNKEEILNQAMTFGFGGMSEGELNYIYDYCTDKDILELGCEVGQSSYVMASVAKSLICVDAWDDSYDHLIYDELQKEVYLNSLALKQNFNSEIQISVYDQFKNNCKSYIKSSKITPVKGMTLDVVDNFKDAQFDLILIDADHSFQGVYNDINAYLPKLKPDGYLMFHDWGCGMWTGVKGAADLATSEDKIEFVTRSERVAIYKLK